MPFFQKTRSRLTALINRTVITPPCFRGSGNPVHSIEMEKIDLGSVLRRTDIKFGNRTGLICDGRPLTFRELIVKSRSLADGFREMGIRKKDGVGILMPNRSEFVISFLAVGLAGAIAVPIDLFYRPPEIAGLIRDLNIRVLITDREHLDTAGQVKERCSCLKEIIADNPAEGVTASISEIIQKNQKRPPLPKISPDHPLLCLFTSGTTGTPKSVLLSHANVIARGSGYWKRYPFSENDRCYNLAPLFRGAALFSVVITGIYYGIPMILPSRFAPEKTWDEIRENKATIIHANPFHFGVLANLPKTDKMETPPIRICYSSGNRLPEKVADHFHRRYGFPVWERYGTVEAGGISVDGRLRQGVKVRIAHKDSQEEGEIRVKTPFMAGKYLNSTELSKNHFKKGWFHTGDIGRIGTEGRLHIHSRKKNQVEISGNPVFPDQVTAAIRRHPKVRNAMVVRFDGEDGAVGLRAYVVTEADCEEIALKAFLHQSLNPWEIPGKIEFRESLPRSWKSVIEGGEQSYPVWGEY